MFIHVVTKGENLWQIANFYKVPIAKILEANQLPDSNHLVLGEAIIIPVEQVYHTVRRGETLWGIARRYEVSLIDLLKLNTITNQNNITTGTVLVIPIKRRPEIYINAYIYELKAMAAAVVRGVGEHLTYLCPFAYRIKEDGNLEQIVDPPVINAALEKKAVAIMAITNFTSTELGDNLAHIILASESIQRTLINNIVNIMIAKRYKGVNIDFENVLPADRQLYNKFLQFAVNRLHARGFFVSTALAPKTSATQKGSLYEAHDYEAHGKIVDFVVLMTYEWGFRMGPPQAISPINKIKEVIDYAVSVIPRDKIYFGFQIYARDWVLPHVKGQEAETFSNQEAIKRAVNYNAVIKYDSKTQSPFYNYVDKKGIRHEVWFEDARSAQAKFDMVKRYNLKGISYWALGYPYPQNWTLLEDNFTIKKL